MGMGEFGGEDGAYMTSRGGDTVGFDAVHSEGVIPRRTWILTVASEGNYQMEE